MIFDIKDIEIFILMLVRVTAALAAMPIFGQQGLPSMLKAGLGVLFVLLLFPVVPHVFPGPKDSLIVMFVLAVKETICGLLIGYATNAVFWAVEFAGAIIGYQTGFSIVASIDPMTNIQNAVLGRIQYIMVALIFLSMNGHHLFLSGLAQSFEIIPLGTLHLNPHLLQWILGIAAGVSEMAIKLSAPIMVALLMTDVGLGILARVAPQMNIFVIGFSLKVGIVLVLMSSGMGTLAWLFTEHFSEFSRQFMVLIKLLGPA